MDTLLSVFGYFDWFVLAILLVVNYYKWNSFPPLKGCAFIATLLILFVFSLPVVSMFIEIKWQASSGNDAFNLLNTYFKFPVYWILGIIQMAIIYLRGKKAS
ncbi:hypothetical protein [Mariniflexile sp.]|uniref:hypothetical protein n=1 Tax=Mariniflexile sp. TaxID=1979402 RepID=UPI0040489FE9